MALECLLEWIVMGYWFNRLRLTLRKVIKMSQGRWYAACMIFEYKRLSLCCNPSSIRAGRLL